MNLRTLSVCNKVGKKLKLKLNETHFPLQIMDGLPEKDILPPQAFRPLQLPTVDHALENCPAGSPFHIKLVAQWKSELRIFEKVPEEKVNYSKNLQELKVQ